MKKLWFLYAILFPVYPVLFLYSYNNGYLPLGELFAPLAITLCGAGIMLGLLRLITRKLDTAAALTAFWGLWFFSYGHLLGAAEFFPGRLMEVMGRSTIWIWLVVLALGALVILRLRGRLAGGRAALFTVAAVLVAATAVKIATFEIGSTPAADPGLQQPAAVMQAPALENPSMAPAQPPIAAASQKRNDPSNYPDIYYIILDGYARPDVFQELYGESNQAFVNFLQEKGFIIAGESHANYYITALSLASSLNMCYLEEVARRLGKKSADQRPAIKMLRHSELFKLLHSRGYKIFSTGDEPFADIQVKDKKGGADEAVRADPDFSTVVLDITPLRLLVHRTHGGDLEEVDHAMYAARRASIFSFFNKLCAVPQSPSPRFVMAHLLAPHPPLVLNRDGSPVPQTRPFALNDNVIVTGSNFGFTRAEYIARYREQYNFVTARIERALSQLLAQKNSRPRIIILQSDHGPAAYHNWNNARAGYPRERMAILNAFHFSSPNHPQISSRQTPVNTFRIICNYYFNTSYPRLPDKSFIANGSTIYDFIDVTDKTGKLPPDKLPRPQ
jgi:hypothetical protein